MKSSTTKIIRNKVINFKTYKLELVLTENKIKI